MSDDSEKQGEAKSDSSLEQYLALLTKPATDLSKPSLTRLGVALGALVEAGLHIFGIGKVFEYNAQKNKVLAENLKRFSSNLDSEKQENIRQIPPEIAHPLLEQFCITSNEELRTAYVNLATNAAKSTHANLAHPSFTNLIRSLSPDEILLLNSLKYRIVTANERKNTTLYNSLSFPVVEYGIKQHIKSTELRHTNGHYLSFFYCTEGLLYPDNIEFYVGNLLSLGMLKTNYSGHVSGEATDGVALDTPSKEYLELDAKARELIGQLEKPWELYTIHGILSPTEKAIMFLDAIFEG